LIRRPLRPEPSGQTVAGAGSRCMPTSAAWSRICLPHLTYADCGLPLPVCSQSRTASHAAAAPSFRVISIWTPEDIRQSSLSKLLLEMPVWSPNHPASASGSGFQDRSRDRSGLGRSGSDTRSERAFGTIQLASRGLGENTQLAPSSTKLQARAGRLFLAPDSRASAARIAARLPLGHGSQLSSGKPVAKSRSATAGAVSDRRPRPASRSGSRGQSPRRARDCRPAWSP